MEDGFTVPELSRNIEALRADVERLNAHYLPRESFELRIDAIERQMQARDEALSKDMKALNDRLTTMQNWQTWAVRLIIGTLITVLLSTVAGALLGGALP